MRTLVLAATVVTLAALMPSPNHAQSGTDLGPITDQTLRQPAPEDWLTTRRTRNGWAHSPLDQINHGNVHKMQVVWDEQVDDENGHGTPLVHKGVMYLRRGDDRIEARQAATGKTLWTYHRDQQTGPKWQGRQEDGRGFGIFQSASAAPVFRRGMAPVMAVFRPQFSFSGVEFPPATAPRRARRSPAARSTLQRRSTGWPHSIRTIRVRAICNGSRGTGNAPASRNGSHRTTSRRAPTSRVASRSVHTGRDDREGCRQSLYAHQYLLIIRS